jgi:hypothetical protein
MQANSKKIAIVQSNYIPWKGYFDLIAAVDEFIVYDDMQYTTVNQQFPVRCLHIVRSK